MKRILMVAFMAMAANFVAAQVKTDTLPQVRKSGILYVVDGVVASKSTYDKLGPDDIENITVLRNIEKVMVINTKAAYDSVKVLRVYRARVTDPSGDSGEVEVVSDKNNNIISMGKFEPDSTIKTHKYVVMQKKNNKYVKTTATYEKGGKKNPLIIVKNADGQIRTVEDMSKIDKGDIKMIMVNKASDSKQFEKYGDISNGVVIIEVR
jgi:hypothetical protein